MDPVSLGVAGGLSILGGASSASGARGAASAAGQTVRNAREASRVTLARMGTEQGIERERISRNAQLIRGRIRATLSDSGRGDGGTAEALLRQADIDEALNREVSDLRFGAAAQDVQRRTDAITVQAFSGLPNPILSGFTGLLQGATAGLSIMQGLDRITQSQEENP